MTFDPWEYRHWDDPDPSDAYCEECKSTNIQYITEHGYGADADGNRGMTIRYWECKECGHTW